MSDGIRVEVTVRGCLGGDLLAMMRDLAPRTRPRHTVITLDADQGRDLVGLLHALERAGVELERVTPG